MKKFMLSMVVIAAIGFTSCSSDDDNNNDDDSQSDCVTCAGYEIAGQEVPEIEVCEGENGNAFVLGVDQTVSYNTYITSLELLTTCN